ncbi:MAG: FecR domain-containing protein [Acidobacteria bacterium]|nr:FecR domain-containing protein [Acidobacteriota bacterium]
MLRTPLMLSVSMWIAGCLTAFGQDDSPGRGVARLSLLSGDVSVRRGDTNEWVAGAANGPLLAGDRVLSGAASRAEVQFDWANLLRLSSNTELRLTEVERERYQVQLARGTVTVATIRESSLDGEISTPSIAVRPLRRGIYRIAVRETDSGPVTEVTVRSGEVEVFSPRGTQRLRPGRTLLARGEYRDPEFQLVAAQLDDDWDRWNERRNRDLLKSTAYDYVSRDVAGADELDGYGTWVNSSPYGWVWQPHVAVDWAPYRQGRWSWVDWYGWTWVSYDPWGWAPYHYGRWFWNANRWCWWPGGVGSRQFWRPALVSWVGWGGGGISLGVGFGGGWGRVGWIPLAPYETFHPWYGSRWYGRGGNNTTIINNINVTNVYRNARVSNGVTVVEADHFGRGGAVRHVGREGLNLERATSVRGQLPVVPDRNTTRFSDQPSRVADGDGGRSGDRFYSRRESRPVDRVSFADQQRGMERVARETFGDRTGPADRGVMIDRGAIAGRGSSSEAAPIRTDGAGVRGRDADTRRVGEGGEGWHRVGSGSDVAGPAARGRDEMDPTSPVRRRVDAMRCAAPPVRLMVPGGAGLENPGTTAAPAAMPWTPGLGARTKASTDAPAPRAVGETLAGPRLTAPSQTMATAMVVDAQV